MKQILSTREAAYFCDCSPDDLSTAAKAGKILAQKRGKHWHFHVRSLEAWKRKLGSHGILPEASPAGRR